MQFPWTKNAHRRELLAQPFPAQWLEHIAANVAYYHCLPAEEQAKLRDITRILIAEKNWEGCAGLTLTEEIKVTIAAQAALLVLNFDGDYYPNVETILVYPQGFLVSQPPPGSQPRHCRRNAAAFRAGGLARAGHRFLVVCPAGRQASAGDGHNVVLHEFAHKLDMRDGAADGAPYLQDAAQIEDWARVMSAEYQTLVEQTQAGQETLLRPLRRDQCSRVLCRSDGMLF